MLNNIKLLLGISGTDKDAILNALIAYCSGEFCDLTHTEDIDENCVVQMVIYRYSQLGSEGLASENFSGTSFSFAVDYPEFLRKAIATKRRVRTL